MYKFRKGDFGVCLFSALLIVLSVSANAESKNKSYTEVKVENLKIEPEEFKRKDIVFLTRFDTFRTGFHGYMERSGFTSEKYYWLGVAPYNLPVLARKKDFDDMASLKNGMRLKLYGEIKKFTIVPYFREAPRYYLDLEKLEIIPEVKETPKPAPAQAEKTAAPEAQVKKSPPQPQSSRSLPVPKLK